MGTLPPVAKSNTGNLSRRFWMGSGASWLYTREGLCIKRDLSNKAPVSLWGTSVIDRTKGTNGTVNQLQDM